MENKHQNLNQYTQVLNQSIIEYSNILIPRLNNYLINKIQKIQKNALRIILKMGRDTTIIKLH